MGEYTSNLNLYKPAVDESGWGALVSQNFETIDGIVSDTLWLADAPPATASAYDDEFSDSSLGVLWSEFDPGTLLTVSEDSAGLKLELAANAGIDFAGICQSIQSGDFTYTAKIHVSSNAINMYSHIGLFLLEGTSSSSDLYGVALNTTRGGSTDQRYSVLHYNDYQSFNAEKAYITDAVQNSFLYLRIRRNSTTYYFEFSTDGIGWRWLYTDSSFPFTASHVGILLNCEDATYTLTGRASFFRYKNSDVGFDGVVEGNRVNLVSIS